MNAYIFIIIGLVAIFAITEVIAILTHINWIRFIGAIAAIVFLFALTFLFNQNYTVDTKSWKNGVYEISKDADGTFYYMDLADKKIKKAIACLLELMIKSNPNKINYCLIDNYSSYSRTDEIRKKKKCC